jgi:hypothetical protein
MFQPPITRSRLQLILLSAIAGFAGVAALTRCDSSVEPASLRQEHTPPQVSQTAPAAGAQGVSPQAAITVVFSESMDAASIHPGTYRVSVAGVPRPGVIAGLARRFTFTPLAPLPANQRVDVEIRDVADVSGNRLVTPYLFAFQTADSAPLPPRTPSNPNPQNGATGVPIHPVLTWVGDPVLYDVLVGTTPDNLTLRASNISQRSFQPGPLPNATQHFWQIIARSEGGEATGPLWSFTTEAAAVNQPPAEPCQPDPANDALGVPVNVSFSWGCRSDPDGDPLTFDVYLGTTTSPSLVAQGVAGPPFVPEKPLALETRYYWRIVANDGRGGATSSPIWTFQTVDVNDPPSAPAPPITPAHRAVIKGIRVELTWSGGDDPDGDPVTYEVRFGTQDPPPPFDTTTVKSFSVDQDLEWDTRYRWQIVARDDHGHEVPGPVWRFDTPRNPNSPPQAPCTPDPPDGIQGVSPLVTLQWGCGQDPNDDPVTYDVYFGNSEDPPFLDSTTTRNYFVGALNLSTTYYWRIIARDDHGAQGTGPIWSFRTLGLEGSEGTEGGSH